jgi:predicted nucleic acid-binding protein
MFVPDTNVVSELRKVRLGKADPQVACWADTIEAVTLYISAITVLELELGVLLVERRDAKQGRALRIWLDNHVLPEFADRILPVEAVIARRCAYLHVPDPRAERDAVIAATALVHGMTVVTRNANDFAATGVKLFDPWAV